MSKKAYSPTEMQVKAWKKEHGDENIVALSYKLEKAGEESETITAVYRVPRIEDIILAEKAGGEDPIKQNLVLETTVRLGADERVAQMDDVRMSMARKLAAMFKVKDVEVKKL